MSRSGDFDLKRAVVYQYGCPFRADLDAGGMEQLRLANQLWNALVEIERAHEEAKAAIWRSDPACAEAMDVLAGTGASARSTSPRC